MLASSSVVSHLAPQAIAVATTSRIAKADVQQPRVVISKSLGSRLDARVPTRRITKRACLGVSAELSEIDSTENVTGTTTVSNRSSTTVDSLKKSMLAQAATINRGLNADKRAEEEMERIAQGLEVQAAQSPGGSPSFPSDLSKMQGRWRLLYSSRFVPSYTLGGVRPGSVPVGNLGQVYQDVDVASSRLDNVVELRGPQLPFADAPVAVLTLVHSYTTSGTADLTIRYDNTKVELAGSLAGIVPRFDLPSLPEALQPPSSLRSSTFTTTFLDDEVRVRNTFTATFLDDKMRVGRGDQGELRIFYKDQ